MINLISDTVTRPSAEMLQVMLRAKVGDDVFGEDPGVNQLEAYAANLLGKESALFCPSGTMCNQIAIRTHTRPMDEMICESSSHVYKFENGGYAFHSGIAIDMIEGQYGKITADQITAKIKPKADWLPNSRLVVIENTTNMGGGNYYTLDEIMAIKKVCKKRGLVLHMDGARFFNAIVETGDKPNRIARHLDSISICLSKGLGAPVGSLLIGDNDYIAQARKWRKAMGGGMRQAGYLAAAGIYALENNVKRLKEDHLKAQMLAQTLSTLPYIGDIRPVKTNILIFDVLPPLTANNFLEKLAKKGIKAVPFGPQTVRFVTHLDFTEEMLKETMNVLLELV